MPADGDLGHNLDHTNLDAAVLALQAFEAGVQGGLVSATAIVGTTTTAVVFPVPYGAGVTPAVVVTLNVTVVSTRQVGVSGITNLGFNIVLTSNSVTPVPVTWISVAP